MGEYPVQFTGHGRLVLPKKFRREIKDQEVVLSRGFEGSVWGFSVKDFEKEAVKQMEVSATDRQARDLRRYLFSAAERVTLDDQGRFIIPKALLEYASLSLGAVIIGAGDHFEIWNPEGWRKFIGDLTKNEKKEKQHTE